MQQKSPAKTMYLHPSAAISKNQKQVEEAKQKFQKLKIELEKK